MGTYWTSLEYPRLLRVIQASKKSGVTFIYDWLQSPTPSFLRVPYSALNIYSQFVFLAEADAFEWLTYGISIRDPRGNNLSVVSLHETGAAVRRLVLPEDAPPVEWVVPWRDLLDCRPLTEAQVSRILRRAEARTEEGQRAITEARRLLDELRGLTLVPAAKEEEPETLTPPLSSWDRLDHDDE